MQLEFTTKECELLDYERYYHPHPRVQRKLEVVWLKSLGKAEPEISQIANVAPYKHSCHQPPQEKMRTHLVRIRVEIDLTHPLGHFCLRWLHVNLRGSNRTVTQQPGEAH